MARTNKLASCNVFAQNLNRSVGLAEVRHQLRISAAYLSGTQNRLADAGSRLNEFSHTLNKPNLRVPMHVTQAIRNYVPPVGFKVLPRRRGERSIILDWGIIQLFGNTSKATKHIGDKHMLTASKITAENWKRDRAKELERIRCAIADGADSRRMTLLLETVRVVNNNLPFRFGEYEESELLADLVVADEFRATLNNDTVTRAIAELYSSTRQAIQSHLQRGRINNVASFAMVCDFWSSKTQRATKYLGLRVYFVDNNWEFQSILLGTRHYEPMYGERITGSRESFKRWITELLKDFGLSTKDFYGSTSDAGPDVKWMMTKGIGPQWEWCIPHLTNAATKNAFGITPQRKTIKNLQATELVTRIKSTTYAVRSNASMGSLFSEHCEMANAGATTQLIEHKEHRFVSFAKVVRRLLDKWDQLEDWFQERIDKAIRERKSTPEPLTIADDKLSLLQLYGLLNPIDRPPLQ
ncbi:hypothetical protein PHPALM_28062 [Phytophthora palmivora]|uniref:Uncharacterized protein n=1 Tax=Phytophthora palmivora TaxID=4796 RepID=A0A2P4XB12_9STRA|nr:hypothetical protein PHPALM_28062 [Phytophthora palmivora]